MSNSILSRPRALGTLGLLLTLAAGPAASSTAPTQGFGPANHAEAELFARPVDGGLQVAIPIRIDEGFHLYGQELGHPHAVGLPTTVTLSGPGLSFGPVQFPEPHPYDQSDVAGEGAFILGFEGDLTAYAFAALEDGSELPALDEVTATVKGLTCEESGVCVPYSQDLVASGPGADALFAAFPAELQPQAAPAAPTPRRPGAYGGASGSGSKASSALYGRFDGDDLRLAIDIDIARGFHLYGEELGHEKSIGKPTVVTLEAPDGLLLGPVWFPEPERFDQSAEAGEGVFINGYSRGVTLYVRGEVAEGADPPPLESISASISGLTCEDGGFCVSYRQDVTAEGEGPDALFAAFPDALAAGPLVAAMPSDDDGPESPVDAGAGATGHSGDGHSGAGDYSAWTFEQYSPRESVEGATGGLGKWLLLAFLAGAILNVMPCVLPVISIKVLSFVQQAGEDKRRVLQLGLAFAAGILVVFWGLAAFAITTSAGWGEQFQSQKFLIGMIAVVFAFSLSMFGVYELGVPAKVGELASTRREGMGDAFFKGMLATALATPCSGPFLGSTLTWTLKQPAFSIFLIFTALGMGMAIPYVILTANPNLLKKLPRPGPWMDTFKQGMGFVLVGTALFLMLSVKPELLILTLIFLLFTALGCWWYGRFATFDKPLPKRLAHTAAAFVIAGLGARLAFVDLANLGGDDLGEGWVHFEPELLEESLAGGRSVFVDFTADWCVNCKTNKLVVYDSDEVQAMFKEKGVLVLEADETGSSAYTEMLARLRQQLGANSIPFMAVFPADRPTEPIVHHSIITKGRMLEILESLPAGGGTRVGRADPR